MTSLKHMTSHAVWRATLLLAGSTTVLAQEAPRTEGGTLETDERIPAQSDGGQSAPVDDGEPRASTGVEKQPPEAKPRVRIKGVSAAGSGCRSSAGLLETACTGDGHCRANFEGYALRARPSAPIQAKTCTVWLNVEAEPGTQVAVSGFRLFATANLAKGTSASVDGTTGFLGSSINLTNLSQVRLAGPYPTDGNPHLQIEGTPTPLVWSPCGYKGPLEVRTNISLRSEDGSSGYVAIDGVTASIVDRVDTRPSGLNVDITSRRCGPLD